MSDIYKIKPIAVIKNDFTSKFGIPRQSGILDKMESKIIFEPEYRVGEALRGIEQYSHLWLIWLFSQSADDKFRPTVRPPRLGGNKRVECSPPARRSVPTPWGSHQSGSRKCVTPRTAAKF